MTNDLTTTNTSALTTTHAPDFDRLIDLIAPVDGQRVGMVAASSARVYRATYAAWSTWCEASGVDPLDVNYNTASAFLSERTATKATKQRELSALRTVAKMLAVADFNNPARRAALESLDLLKVRSTGEGRKSERQRRALNPADADRLLRVWRDDASARGIRNRALVAVALLAGLRAAELGALTWNDIDLVHGVITVRHGKGDKTREAALYGVEAVDALTAWRTTQPEGYHYVFVALRRGDTFTGDAPMTTTAIWQVVTDAGERAGLGHVKPHDLRRTLATELLETGAPVHHVQQQLGHSDSSTTLNNYTGRKNASERRTSGKVRYG